jgi:argininosuccinate synthase
MMQVSVHRYPAVPVSSVQILYQEPTKPYEVIALVSHMNSLGLPISREIAAVREEAAKLGADAVLIIDAKQRIPFITGENVTTTGNAIKWTD